MPKKDIAKKKEKHALLIEFPVSVYEDLREMHHKERMPMAEIVRQAVIYKLKMKK